MVLFYLEAYVMDKLIFTKIVFYITFSEKKWKHTISYDSFKLLMMKQPD